ncbi:FAD-binding oxidoreductase [Sinosporangium siamense]|uniref:FAD-linked oxidase n=1 Tax=Sinosporangium siamense TaxID=1367973 RepID=A0A919RH51_9ACTN|nr:FAD-linked oxidase C-terminal domain-containing protein [Sinosporangium siamense]GII91871.1 FAD-linked oxidase [Sinosporangium siamense]
MTTSLDLTWLPALRAGLSSGCLHEDPETRERHSRDSAPFSPAGVPAVVVTPETVEQVQHVLRVAHSYGVPVVPQGARTGLAGAANADEGCIVLSLLRMNRILEIDPGNRLVRCEPGVTNRALSDAVAGHGLFFPPDPASWNDCTIGGNIAVGAGGLCCVKYGVTADYVLGLSVVTADGELVRMGRRTVKGVAGYDLTKLFVGSEGTLGVIVEATLSLRPAQPPSLAMLAQFPSATAAGEAVAAIIAAGHVPSALELMDQVTTAAVAALGHPMLTPDASATLIVECDGDDPSAELSAIAELCRTAGALNMAVAADQEQSKQVLDARRLVLPALQRHAATQPGRPTAFIEDVAVPRTRLAEFIDQIAAIAEKHDLYISTVGHAGDGNLHPTVVFDQSDPDAFQRAEQAYDAIMAAGLELGGTITGEHGVGILKREWLRRELDPAALRIQQAIKSLLDPKNILNPGKVLY